MVHINITGCSSSLLFDQSTCRGHIK